MNDVDAVAVGHCPTAAGNYNGNGIVHGSGPSDNYIPALTAIPGPVTIRTCIRIVQRKA